MTRARAQHYAQLVPSTRSQAARNYALSVTAHNAVGAYRNAANLTRHGYRFVRKYFNKWRSRTKQPSKQKVQKKSYKKENRAQRLIGISQHNDLQNLSGGVIRLGFRKIRVTGRFTYQNGKEHLFGGSDGSQLVVSPEAIATHAQLFGTTAASRFAAIEQWDVDPFLLNPFSTAPTNTVYPGPQPAVSSNDKIALLRCHHKMYMSSGSSAPQTVEIYYLTPTKDCTTVPATAWANALAAENMTQAAAVVDNTIGGNTATGGAAITSKYGLNPMKCKTFTKEWRCLKYHKLVFQPGDRQTITTNFIWNKKFEKEQLSVRASGYYAKTTIYPLMIIRGSLVGVEPIAGGVASEVTFSAPKLGCITESTYTFGALPVSRFNTNRTYAPYLVGASGVGTQALNEINDVDVKAEVATM